MSDLLSPILFDGYKVYKEAEQSVAGLIPEHVSAVLDVVVRHMRAEQSAQPPCGADGAVLVDISDVEERIGGMSPGDDDFAEGWNALLTLLRTASHPAAPVAPAVLASVEARYADLLGHLGVGGHDGAIAEIGLLRRQIDTSVAPATVAVPDALAALSSAMKSDPDFAWTWHCNVAMTAQDAGAPHDRANVWAANFMQRAFDVDTLTRVNAEIAASQREGGA